MKPSEISQHTTHLVADLIRKNFSKDLINIFEGGKNEATELLQLRFDYIFFTGSTHIGKIVMQHAALNLTPLTLELGGKSPAIIDDSIDLDFAARKIMWAKFNNVGQTCIAPDYVLIPAHLKAAFVQKCKTTLKRFFGENPRVSKSYGRIVNQHHFTRLVNLMQSANLIVGGEADADHLYIAPTLLDEIDYNHPIMQEEIFGPLLPIINYESFDDVLALFKDRAKPLALYLFSKNRSHQQDVKQFIACGGICINDCLVHFANYHLPFGGVGASGFGNYRGHYSFETFSHAKAIYHKTLNIDSSIQYPPYTAWKDKIIRFLLRFTGK